MMLNNLKLKRKYFLFLNIVFLLTFVNINYSQNHNEYIWCIDIFINTSFKPFSVDLDEINIKQIDTISKDIIKFREEKTKRFRIQLNDWHCYSEQLKNKYIFVCRAKNIIDYMIKNYNFTRNSFVLSDNDETFPIDFCYHTGVNIGLQLLK